MPKRLIRPFRGPRGRVRRSSYGSILVMLAVYLAIYHYTDRDGAILARSFCYTIAGFLYIVGGKNIRQNTQYHPAYKMEKNLGGVGFLGLGASLAVGFGTSSNGFLWIWLAILLVAQIGSFEFILYRNHSASHQYLSTIAGPIAYPDSTDDADAVVDHAVAILRHHLSSAEMREAVRDALGAPTGSEIAEDMRRQIARRRQQAMAVADDAAAVEAESWG